MSITSDEVNYLVYRYLLESGFTHSTFAFQHETAIHRADIKDASVRPGALIALLQKGLQYLEVETHIQENGTERRCIAPFTLLGPHECQVVPTEDDDYEMRMSATSKKRRDDGIGRKDKRDDRKTNKRNDNRDKRIRRESSSLDDLVDTQSGRDRQSIDPHMDSDTPMIPTSSQFTPSEVRVLSGHQGEVFTCSWHPTEYLLATGSGDGTVRIWDASDGLGGAPPAAPIVLIHSKETDQDKDVTTLDWNPDGSCLATGAYDGAARIWTKRGEIKFIMRMHSGPVFCLKWSKKGELLLTGSIDKTAIVWDANSGESRQQFQFHSAPILDIDWRDDSTFATCSTDHQIYVCELGSFEPLRQYAGHENEVNAIRWDPTGTYLASCSDDKTAKIWSLDQDTPIWEITVHQKGIYSMRWGPLPVLYNANGDEGPLYLATAAFDGELRVWDFKTRTCLFSLLGHTDAVYSVSFSPSGQYLASGSFDQSVLIWSLKDGSLIRSYHGMSGLFEVTWNSKGNRVAASYVDGRVVIFDVGNL